MKIKNAAMKIITTIIRESKILNSNFLTPLSLVPAAPRGVERGWG